MADAGQLFDLAATISADTSRFDRSITETSRKVKSLENDLKHLDWTASTALKSSGSSIKGALDPLDQLKAEFGGKFATLRNELQDLGSKAGATAGDMGKFGGSVSALAGPLALLGIALAGNAAAVVALHKSLAELSLKSVQTQTEVEQLYRKYGTSVETISAAQILAAQSGRTLNDVLKDSRADLDAAIVSFDKFGVVMGYEDVVAARKLNNELVLLEYQWRALEIQVGKAITPQTEAIVRSLSNALRENKTEVELLAGAVGLLAAYLGGNLVGAIQVAGAALAVLQSYLAPLAAMIQFINGLGGVTGNIPVQPASFGVGGAGSVGAGIFRAKVKKGGGGGGGGGSKTDAGATLLQQLQRELFRLREHTELEEIQEQLLEKQYARTSDQIKKRIMITAIEIDAITKVLSVTRERFASEASYARFAEEEFTKSLTRARALAQIERERFATRAGQNRPSWIDLGGGSIYGGEPGATTRPRIATAELAVLREQMEAQRQKIQALAGDLTNAIDQAIRVGFERGIKAGFASLLQSLLQMIHEIFLRKLAEGIAGILTNVMGSGGGSGSIFGKIAGIAIGAAAAGFGGGGSSFGALGSGMSGGFAGGFAQGGFIPPGMWGIVGEHGPEPVRAGMQGATVAGGQHVHNHYWNIQTPNPQSFMSRDTKAQISRQYARVLQKTTLMG